METAVLITIPGREPSVSVADRTVFSITIGRVEIDRVHIFASATSGRVLNESVATDRGPMDSQPV